MSKKMALTPAKIINLLFPKPADFMQWRLCNKYKLIIDNLPQKIFIKDKNSVYIFCNNNYAADLKILPEDIIGKTDYDFYPKDVADKYKRDDQRVIESGKSEELEEKYVQAGKEAFVQTIKKPVRDKKGHVVGIVGIFWDITEHILEDESLLENQKELSRRVDERTAELMKANELLRGEISERNKIALALEENITRYKIVTENVTDLIWTIDMGLRFTYVSPSVSNLLGYSIEEMIGRKVDWCLVPSSVRIVKDVLEAEMALEQTGEGELSRSKTLELEITCKDKSAIWTETKVTFLRDANNRPIGFLGVTRDITERKKLDQLKNDFVNTVSHELRTPLAITEEAISFILDGTLGAVNEQQNKILVTARDNINWLSRIINELLDISKIEAGRVKLKRELVNITALCKHIAFLFDPKIKERHLELRLCLPQEDLYIYVDSDRIIQVLTNLIANAIKFTEKGYIEISARENEDSIECSVADTGAGIPKERLPKVFTKFEQFGRTAGPGDKGTGLGLSITKGIIELHKGRIWVESEIDKGTRFTFVLPKYNIDELAVESISDLMKEAMRDGVKMTCVFFTLVKTAQSERSGEYLLEETEPVLKGLEVILRNSLRKTKDTVFRGFGGIGILLYNCNKDNSNIAWGRLEPTVKDYLSCQKLDKVLELKINFISYPDDSGTIEGFIDKVKRAS